MRRHRRARYGDGTAWLVADRVECDYLCYWYTGTGGGHLVEHARAASAEEAVAWGRQRTPRVRIRTADARTSWAGTTPTPEGFAHAWTQPDTANIVFPPHSKAGSLSPGLADEPAGRSPASSSPIRDGQIQPPERRQFVGARHTPSGGAPC